MGQPDEIAITKWSDNSLIYRLGEIAYAAGDRYRRDVGDHLDRGLILIRLLEESGFTVMKEV